MAQSLAPYRRSGRRTGANQASAPRRRGVPLSGHRPIAAKPVPRSRKSGGRKWSGVTIAGAAVLFTGWLTLVNEDTRIDDVVERVTGENEDTLAGLRSIDMEEPPPVRPSGPSGNSPVANLPPLPGEAETQSDVSEPADAAQPAGEIPAEEPHTVAAEQQPAAGVLPTLPPAAGAAVPSLHYLASNGEGGLELLSTGRGANSVREAISALSAPPDSGDRILLSYVDPELRVNGFTLHGDTLLLDLNETMDEIAGRYLEEYQGTLAQIGATLLSMPGVGKVRITINGEQRDFLGNDGLENPVLTQATVRRLLEQM